MRYQTLGHDSDKVDWKLKNDKLPYLNRRIEQKFKEEERQEAEVLAEVRPHLQGMTSQQGPYFAKDSMGKLQSLAAKRLIIKQFLNEFNSG